MIHDDDDVVGHVAASHAFRDLGATDWSRIQKLPEQQQRVFRDAAAFKLDKYFESRKGQEHAIAVDEAGKRAFQLALAAHYEEISKQIEDMSKKFEAHNAEAQNLVQPFLMNVVSGIVSAFVLAVILFLSTLVGNPLGLGN